MNMYCVVLLLNLTLLYSAFYKYLFSMEMYSEE